MGYLSEYWFPLGLNQLGSRFLLLMGYASRHRFLLEHSCPEDVFISEAKIINLISEDKELLQIHLPRCSNSILSWGDP